MIFTVIAIDDELYVLEDFLDTVKVFPKLNVIATFCSVVEAMPFLEQNGPVHFIFSDIQMPGISGIEAGKILKSHCEYLVYMTGHSQFRKESYSLFATGYFMKPVNAVDIHELIEHVKTLRTGIRPPTKALPEFLLVMTMRENAHLKLEVEKIISITTMTNYVKVHTKDEDYTRYGTMAQVEKLLCDTGHFLRISRSTIIALTAIQSAKNDIVLLKNGVEYRISRLRKAEFLRFFDET